MELDHYSVLPVLVLILRISSCCQTGSSPELLRIDGPRVLAEHSDATLTCSVLSTELHNCSVHWYYARSQHQLSQEDCSFESNGLLPADGSSTSLPIRNASRSNAGVYQCCCRPGRGDVSIAYMFLSVLTVPKGHPPIISNAANNAGTLVVPGRKIQITLHVASTSPDPIVWSIFDETGRDVCASVEGYSIFSCDFGEHEKSIVKTQVKRSDSGWLTMAIDIGGDTASYRLNVLIHGEPSNLRMDNVSARLRTDSGQVELVCHGAAYPPPVFTFKFTPCPSLEWAVCRERMLGRTSSMMAISNTTSGNDTTDASINAVFAQPSSPGIVQCTAINGAGAASTESLLFLRNFDEPMQWQIISPSGTIYDTDTIVVQCRADGYDFTNNLTIAYHGHRQTHHTNHRAGGTYFWSVDYTILPPHNTSADNVVWCYAAFRNGTVRNETLELSIRQPMAPRIVNGSDYENVTANRSETLTLHCSVHGDPEPVLSWSRNLKPLAHSGSTLNATLLSDEGETLYSCQAQNRFGEVAKVWKVSVAEAPPVDRRPAKLFSDNTILLMGTALVLALAATVLCYTRVRRSSKIAAELPAQDSEEIIPSEYEFARKRLKLGKQIGQGQFGVVLLATAQHILVSEPSTTVAVKMVKRSRGNKTDANEALLEELTTLVAIGQHLNVVNLLGAVTRGVAKGGFMIILEYCPFGCLEDYLRQNKTNFIDCRDNLEQSWQYFLKHEHVDTAIGSKRPTRDFRTTDLICWAAQVANGMAYLAGRNFVHGDLAARNVLLCCDNVVKIGDFGLACIVETPGHAYQRKDKGPLPIRWLALESISERLFSTKTDVWAYGVMLWEFFSLGAQPYAELPSNECLLKEIRDGYRMDKPPYASEEIFDHMLTCWYVNPQRRPSFLALASTFNAMLPDELQNHYIALNGPYIQPYQLLKSSHDAYVTTLNETFSFPSDVDASIGSGTGPSSPGHKNGTDCLDTPVLRTFSQARPQTTTCKTRANIMSFIETFEEELTNRTKNPV